MSDHKEHQGLPRTPIMVGIVAVLAELVCVLFVHGSHRAAVAVVSGQATGDVELGWLVVLAEMASVLVLPPVIIAAALGLAFARASASGSKPLHTARSCK